MNTLSTISKILVACGKRALQYFRREIRQSPQIASILKHISSTGGLRNMIRLLPSGSIWRALLLALLPLIAITEAHASTGCRLIAHGANELWTLTANVAVNANGRLAGGSVTLQYIDKENISGLGLGPGSIVSVLLSDTGRKMNCASLGGGALELIVSSSEGDGYLKFNSYVVGKTRTSSGTDSGNIVLRIVVQQDSSAMVEVYPTGIELRGATLPSFTVRFNAGVMASLPPVG